MCKEKVLERICAQLEAVFTVIHAPEVAQEELHDISIAYGHLVRASQLQQFSDHFVEVVCEQVGINVNITLF